MCCTWGLSRGLARPLSSCRSGSCFARIFASFGGSFGFVVFPAVALLCGGLSVSSICFDCFSCKWCAFSPVFPKKSCQRGVPQIYDFPPPYGPSVLVPAEFSQCGKGKAHIRDRKWLSFDLRGVYRALGPVNLLYARIGRHRKKLTRFRANYRPSVGGQL